MIGTFIRANILPTIQEILDTSDNRKKIHERICKAIQKAGNYRWVGIYEVGKKQISNIAWSGPGAPAYPTFPVAQGLSGQAVADRMTIVCNDVASDPRYLTAFENTGSEIIVPIVQANSHKVLGTIDVESSRTGAFTARDKTTLEQCAELIAGGWK